MSLLLALSGCAVLMRSQPPSAKWTTGYWFWQGTSIVDSPAREKLDVLFFQAGTIRIPGSLTRNGPWSVDVQLPDRLPPAKDYWLVLRCETRQIPDLTAAPVVARRVSEIRAEALQRHLNVVGVQLDIDSPTSALQRYAETGRA
jgi:hypothetical protein